VHASPQLVNALVKKAAVGQTTNKATINKGQLCEILSHEPVHADQQAMCANWNTCATSLYFCGGIIFMVFTILHLSNQVQSGPMNSMEKAMLALYVLGMFVYMLGGEFAYFCCGLESAATRCLFVRHRHWPIYCHAKDTQG
jgi:hypothetical protein